MHFGDQVSFSLSALNGYRLRSVLSVLGIAIGITAVILLTSIGEGTRRYVFTSFSQFGTNLLSLTPGKSKTTGMPGVLGGTTRKLTIDDAEAIGRLPGVLKSQPQTTGLARVEASGRGRSVPVYGATADMPDVLKFNISRGSFLPPGDPRRGASVAVLGPKLERELFGDASGLGQIVRIGESRFRVIGILQAKGKLLGFDLDDAAYIPIAAHMRLFNLDGLEQIHIMFSPGEGTERVVETVRAAMTTRHDGEDFTIETQAAMLEVFDNVMAAVTMSVGAMAGISLCVGAIGILTMMWIAVGERTSEIGLARALGATARQVQTLFLFEAVALAVVGGLLGVIAGLALASILRSLVPGLPVETPIEFVLAAIAVSVVTGLASGVMPARRAARLDPIEALRAE